MVGIDIVFVPRISIAMENEGFLKSFLLEEEIAYVLGKAPQKNKNCSPRCQTAAGLFAAKEAVLKAFGVGITNGFGLKDVCIWHSPSGAPMVRLSKKLMSKAKEQNKSGANVSISHDGDYAVAIATLE